jgi:general secretion pathway protein H
MRHFLSNARNASCGARSAGFTLIEILVVVVIIAIVASVAVISVNALGRDTEIADETRRLVGLIGMVREQAEMEGRDYGLRLEEARYDFMLHDVRTDQWQVIEDDRLLRPRELPPGLRLGLRLDGREVILRPPPDRKKPRPPQILMLSSGDLSVFELRLEREDSDHEATIEGKADGEITVTDVDEAVP